jgi:hypothetical protein
MRCFGPLLVVGLCLAIAVVGGVAIGQPSDDTAPTTPSAPRSTPAAVPPEPLVPEPDSVAQPLPAVEPVAEETPSEGSPAQPLLPPLGLNDVLDILEALAAGIGKSGVAPSQEESNRSARLDQATLYLEHLVAITSGRVRYRWTQASKGRVRPDGERTVTMRQGTVVKGVSAVRFHSDARRGSVRVIHLGVRDSEGRIHSYPVERLVRHDLPKWEVVFLNEATDVEALLVTAVHASDLRCRIYAELGVPDQPEYAREALHFASECQRHLREGDLESARLAALRAHDRLRTLQSNLDLGTKVPPATPREDPAP